MKSFKEFINEMPQIYGEYRGGFNREYDWNEIRNTKFVDKVEDNISTNNYMLYKSSNKFWLCTKELEYLGHIQYGTCSLCPGVTLHITESFSNIRGFYPIMFLHIFKNTHYTIIMSDNFQSTQAKDSWGKLLKGYGKELSGIYDIKNRKLIKSTNIESYNDYWGTTEDYLNYRAFIAKSNTIYETITDVYNRRYGVKQYEDGIYSKLVYPNNQILDKMLYTEYGTQLDIVTLN